MTNVSAVPEEPAEPRLPPPPSGCAALAHSNIALVKYWGKRDVARNLPDVPSLSLTLEGLSTTTRVRFEPARSEDLVELNGAPAEDGTRRKVVALLDRVRAESGLTWRACVSSANDFPTASGLASSASGFAALAVAALGAAGLPRHAPAASALARASSVSAARSIYGGFVELPAGAERAEPLEAEAASSSLRMVIAITQLGPKAVGSTQGMLLTQRTSPYYEAWRATAPALYSELRQALLRCDFEQVGQAMEQSTLCMHATMLAARPALMYWTAATLGVVERVRDLRSRGTFAYFTMDAGPHVKILTLEPQTSEVRRALEGVPGVQRVLVSAAGGPARVLEAG